VQGSISWRSLALSALVAGGLAAVRPAAAQTTPGQTGYVAGVVRDTAGVVVVGAQVSLAGLLGRGTTGTDGSFRLSGPGGDRRLVVRRLGFRPESLAVAIPPGGTTEVAVRLVPTPQTLAPVVVATTDIRRYAPRLRAFHERRERGFGRFFTAEEIDRRNPAVVTDLLRTVPGTRITRVGGQSVVTFRNQSCVPLIWIDGMPAVAGYLDPDVFQPNSLAGIEVYSGPSTVPSELMWVRGKGSCGVIALWTRMPELKPRTPKRQYTAQDLANLVASLRLYTADQVDVPAAPDTANPVMPIYPDSLLRTGVEGRVLVEFVVDTTGVPDPETFGVVLTTNALFTESVRRAVLATRFTPALREGSKVRQLVQMPFRFEHPDREPGRRADDDH
jgi:TonB family protein